ncbi:S8 family serine peptidase [Kutzneria buriramensis]|uniref:Subtilase family protein n=1 Tax=Kutzneria buriramensis TaxID=1045776 RepID=A0A3E0HI31_9PSEU|nr:S53 family peptidase [Kutzneria buriramensis]REH46097.1 subtilase family protein [Kutzneria buriramensis]
MRLFVMLATITAAALTVQAPVAICLPRTATVRDACGTARPGHARCFAKIRTDVHGGHMPAAASPAGYAPADLRSAYNLPATGGRGQTVAVVDAYDDPDAESDLATYRTTYGLPACTTANGCFRKVNGSGAASPLPSADEGWGLEISLDLDMVSAACPNCRILLVEATSAAIEDLAAAEVTATGLGANEISNSYGIPENPAMLPYQDAYRHPGVAIVAAAGDSGYGIPEFPAVLPSVIAVGGTRLTREPAAARGWAETAWGEASVTGGTGSGCSAWIAKPTWQHDPNCPGRMTADVAADADPGTGPAVYDSYGAAGGPGWTIVGGTSASSPFIAGVIALAGNPTAFPDASYLYARTTALNDVTSGTNVAGPFGMDCGGDYQCNAVSGYDGPTGGGTPNGLAAF